MRVTILAVGRLKGGPEAALIADYLARFTATGRALGLGPASVVEIDERKARDSAQQSRAILEAADGGVLIALDERGKTLTSPKFANLLADRRDAGARSLFLAIGGADGHDAALRARADALLSFGPMVWPHMLARVMASEQLYRAAAILSGAPYHRE